MSSKKLKKLKRLNFRTIDFVFFIVTQMGIIIETCILTTNSNKNAIFKKLTFF